MNKLNSGENSAFKPYRSGSACVHLLPPTGHPLTSVSGGLKNLYERISRRQSLSPTDFEPYTDKDGYFQPAEGMPLLARRYEYTELISYGQSSIVFKAKDKFQNDRGVAIKVLHLHYSVLGAQEANCLQSLNAADPQRYSPVLRLLNTFSIGKHFCMVFELLHYETLTSLFAEKTSSEEKLRCIRKVALRLINALGFLQSHNVIHADLKPENLLLSREKKLNSLKVVDFGNAIHCIHDEMSLYYEDFELQTLLYRAPEVIFGMMFGIEVDMWSLGCILAELYIGAPLFYGKNLEAILTKMQTLLGPLPRELFQRGKFYEKLEHFTQKNVQPVVITDVMRSLNCCDLTFVDFILRLLKYDPASRITVPEAAEHPFLAPELGIRFFQIAPTFGSSSSYSKTSLSQDVYWHIMKKPKQNCLISPAASLGELNFPEALKKATKTVEQPASLSKNRAFRPFLSSVTSNLSEIETDSPEGELEEEKEKKKKKNTVLDLNSKSSATVEKTDIFVELSKQPREADSASSKILVAEYTAEGLDHSKEKQQEFSSLKCAPAAEILSENESVVRTSRKRVEEDGDTCESQAQDSKRQKYDLKLLKSLFSRRSSSSVNEPLDSNSKSTSQLNQTFEHDSHVVNLNETFTKHSPASRRTSTESSIAGSEHSSATTSVKITDLKCSKQNEPFSETKLPEIPLTPVNARSEMISAKTSGGDTDVASVGSWQKSASSCREDMSDMVVIKGHVKAVWKLLNRSNSNLDDSAFWSSKATTSLAYSPTDEQNHSTVKANEISSSGTSGCSVLHSCNESSTVRNESFLSGKSEKFISKRSSVESFNDTSAVRNLSACCGHCQCSLENPRTKDITEQALLCHRQKLSEVESGESVDACSNRSFQLKSPVFSENDSTIKQTSSIILSPRFTQKCRSHLEMKINSPSDLSRSVVNDVISHATVSKPEQSSINSDLITQSVDSQPQSGKSKQGHASEANLKLVGRKRKLEDSDDKNKRTSQTKQQKQNLSAVSVNLNTPADVTQHELRENGAKKQRAKRKLALQDDKKLLRSKTRQSNAVPSCNRNSASKKGRNINLDETFVIETRSSNNKKKSFRSSKSSLNATSEDRLHRIISEPGTKQTLVESFEKSIQSCESRCHDSSKGGTISEASSYENGFSTGDRELASSFVVSSDVEDYSDEVMTLTP